jgi:hypothetical protein
MSTLSHAPSAGELTFMLAQGRGAETRAEEREHRARRRTERGLMVALAMISTYDAVILIAGLHG